MTIVLASNIQPESGGRDYSILTKRGCSRPNREEMFLRYVYKLHDLHLPAENFVEAAFTLKMHADLLGWTNRSLHADLR